jgi:beta-xylosidase
MYYTARKNVAPNVHCVGTATSDTVLGPYHPTDQVFACHDSEGGAIDAFGYVDPATQHRYVVYKVDGNNFGNGGNCNNGVQPLKSTPILLQRVSSDGITKEGPAIEILDREELDGPLVEAPSLAMMGGKYFLFFSSNCYVTDMYDVAFAVADRIEGPYTKRGPLVLSRTFDMHGPGGAEVTVTGENRGYLAFHAGTVGQRIMYEGNLEYLGGTRLRLCLSSGECTEAD